MSQIGQSEPGPFYLGIDLGGTNTKLGVVSHGGVSVSQLKFRTDPDRGFPDWFDRLTPRITEAIAVSGVAAKDVLAIGLATPGTMDIPGGMLLNPPNLPGWVDIPIRRLVQDRFGRPT